MKSVKALLCCAVLCCAVLCWCHSLSSHLFLLRHSAGLCDCSVQTLGLGKEGLVSVGFVFSVGIGTLDLCYTYLNLPSYKESFEIVFLFFCFCNAQSTVMVVSGQKEFQDCTCVCC